MITYEFYIRPEVWNIGGFPASMCFLNDISAYNRLEENIMKLCKTNTETCLKHSSLMPSFDIAHHDQYLIETLASSDAGFLSLSFASPLL